MNFDLLSLKTAKGKIDNAGIATMKAELERRRESAQKLSADEKAHVSNFIKSNMKLVDEGKPFHTTLQRLLGYVQSKA